MSSHWSVQTNYNSLLARVARPFPLNNKFNIINRREGVALASQIIFTHTLIYHDVITILASKNVTTCSLVCIQYRVYLGREGEVGFLHPSLDFGTRRFPPQT